MKSKSFLLIIFALFITSYVLAQPPQGEGTELDVPNGNIPNGCYDDVCLKIYSNCVEKKPENQARFLAGQKVTMRCGSSNREYEYVINEEGIVCLPENRFNLTNCKLCINYKNWHVCEIDNQCNIILSQELDQFPYDSNPKLNGDMFPFNGYYGQWQSRACYNYNYGGIMNSQVWPYVIDDSCDPPFILDMIDFETPKNSGICLQIAVLRKNGSTLFSKVTYLDGQHTEDITGVINRIPADGKAYLMHFRAVCCEEEQQSARLGTHNIQACNMNTYKSLWVRVKRNEMRFDHEVRVTNADCGEPEAVLELPTSPEGPDLPRSIELPGPLSITPFYFEITNWRNPRNKPINYELVSFDCKEEILTTTIASGTFTNTSTGFNMNIITTSPCQCYRIDLTYESICSASGTRTRSLYFRDGADCSDEDPCAKSYRMGSRSENLSDTDQTDLNEYAQESHVDIQVNPIVNGQLILRNNWLENKDVVFTIIDASGKIIINEETEMAAGEHIETVDSQTGIYFYRINEGSHVHSGKFIIQ